MADTEKSLKRLYLEVKGNEALQWANSLHKRITFRVLLTVLALFTSAVVLNMIGWGLGNIVIALVAFSLGAYYAAKPEGVAASFAGGAVINGLPNFKVSEVFEKGLGAVPDFELKKFVGSGFDFIRLYVKAVAHVFNLVGFTAILLVYAPIGERPVVAFLLLAIAVGFGVYSLLYASEFVWLKRINRWILIGGLGYAILLLFPVQTYLSWGFPASWFTDGEERKVAASVLVSAEANQGDELQKGLSGVANKLKQGKRLEDREIDQAIGDIRKAAYTTKERELLAEAETVVDRGTIPGVVTRLMRGSLSKSVLIEGLNGQVVCGFRPGNYRFDHEDFSIDETDGQGVVNHYHFQNGGITLNEQPSGGKVYVDSTGCVTISFVVSDSAKKMRVVPNTLEITLSPTIL